MQLTHQAHTPAQARCPDVTGGAPALTRLLLRSKGCPEQARETQKHRPGPKIALYLHSQYLLQLLRCLLLEHTHQTPMRACSTALQCSWCAAADRGALGLQHPHKSQRLHISSGLQTPVSTTHTTKPLYKHTKKLQLRRQHTQPLALAAGSMLREGQAAWRVAAAAEALRGDGRAHTGDAVRRQQQLRSSRRTWPGSPGHPRQWTEPAHRSLQREGTHRAAQQQLESATSTK